MMMALEYAYIGILVAAAELAARWHVSFLPSGAGPTVTRRKSLHIEALARRMAGAADGGEADAQTGGGYVAM